MEINKLCPICSCTFRVLPCHSKRVYCSKTCGLRGTWKNGKRVKKIGIRMSDSTRKKISETLLKKLSKHQNWSGDSVGYTALHQWIYKRFGQPKECENNDGSITGIVCRNNAKQYDWANKHGKKYTRERSSWIRLCRSCHVIYDRKD